MYNTILEQKESVNIALKTLKINELFQQTKKRTLKVSFVRFTTKKVWQIHAVRHKHNSIGTRRE